MSEAETTFPIDPKELAPAVGGFVIGLCLIGCFVLLAVGLGLTLLVDKNAIPFQ